MNYEPKSDQSTSGDNESLYELFDGDVLIVPSSVVLSSIGWINSPTIFISSHGQGARVTNYGTISARINTAILVAGSGHVIENKGSIESTHIALSFHGQGEGNDLLNEGSITGAVIWSGETNDTFINSGRMVGGVNLGAGNDLYDGRLGSSNAVISGGDGDDVLLGTQSPLEMDGTKFDGGAGADLLMGAAQLSDTAVYASAEAGVVASLAEPWKNAGDAAGDRYISIENLTGSHYNDLLVGDANDNVIDGNSGADTLIGGAGNDIYMVWGSAAVIVEAAKGGHDQVSAFYQKRYVLPDNVEDLTLEHCYVGVGNKLNNTITGSDADTTLYGKAGNDTLVDESGFNTYVFDTKLNAKTNVDMIVYYETYKDTIKLDDAIFKGLARGGLKASAFCIGPAAKDAHDRIIYDPATGALLWDPDGNGKAAAIKFAELPTGLDMTASEFLIF